MCEIPLLLVFIVLTALIFDVTNGAHDSANAIAGIVSTRVLSPQVAVVAAALLNLVGAFLGTEVAKTLGGGIVQPALVNGSQILVLAALLAAISWNLITWYFGIPSSSSHALIGGLAGAGVALAGFEALQFSGIVQKVLLPLVLAPLLGFAAGFLFMWLVYWGCARLRRQTVKTIFSRLQYCSAAFLATSHGMNDAQKTMGIITLALVLFGTTDSLNVQLWVKLACALAMSLGTLIGGWKIIRTMGGRIFKLEPVHGFSAECSASLVIAAASLMGAPVSTTQTISSAIFGVGSTQRLSAVRWRVARSLVTAWLLTLPASGLLGFGLWHLLHLLVES